GLEAHGHGDEADGQQHQEDPDQHEAARPRTGRAHGRTSTVGLAPNSTTAGLVWPSTAARRSTSARAAGNAAPASGACVRPSVSTIASTTRPATPSTSGCRLPAPLVRYSCA